MNRLALIAMALVGATTFLGVEQGCGSDSAGTSNSNKSSKKGGAQNSAGSDDEGSGGSSKSSVGGSKNGAAGSSTSSSKTGGSKGATGGATGGTGGATGATGGATGGTGGATGGTAGATGSSDGKTLTGLTGGLYSQAEFSGYFYTAADKVASTIDPPCGDDTGANCFKDDACVKGTVAKIPKLDDGGYDYDNVWGALVGWNLSVKGDADSDNPPVSIDDYTKISFKLEGSTFPSKSNVRLQMEVPGVTDAYCVATTLTIDGTTATGSTDISKFKTKCWGSEGESWKSGLKPKNLAIQMFASNSKDIPFDFCVTDLKFEK